MNELYQQQDFLYTTFWKMLAWGIFLTCLYFTWQPWSPSGNMAPYRISGDQSANVNWSKTITAIGDVNIKEMAAFKPTFYSIKIYPLWVSYYKLFILYQKSLEFITESLQFCWQLFLKRQMSTSYRSSQLPRVVAAHPSKLLL